MAHPGKSPVRIRARISPAEAALMRLEAKRAKGPNGTLVPEDAAGARRADPLPPRVAPKVEKPAAPAGAEATAAVPAEPKSATAKPDEVAARLEAALRGHLETVASAFASTRAGAARSEAKAETAPGRSIYAPDGPRMPQATPLDIEPLAPLPAAVRPDLAARVPLVTEDAPQSSLVAEAPAFDEETDEDYSRADFEPHLSADADADIGERDEFGEAGGADADRDGFGDAPPRWLTDDDADPADRQADEEEDEPLPRAFQRRAWRKPEGLAHLPPLVETTRGVSAKVLAAATLFGLAAGVGAIATYQYVVAPVATPAIALVPNHPAADSSKIAKIDADRVPQADSGPAVKIASAAASPAASPVYKPAPAAASADAAPLSAPVNPPTGGAVAAASPPSDGGVPPALRQTEDAAAAGVAPADAATGDTEPYVASVASRPAQPKRPASGGEVLAYAPTPPPNDPVARSFFGKGDDAAAAPAAKKSTAGIPAPAPGKAKVLMAVNMRAKPDNDAPSVKILGAGARVQVVQCSGWCEVVADGKHGYIFKKFLDN